VVNIEDGVQFTDLMPENIEEFFVNVPLADLSPSLLIFAA
jgi:hypothetical protein